MALTKVVRQFLPPVSTPARLRTGTTNPAAESEPETVVLRLGEGATGVVFNVSWSLQLQRFMTKCQNEMTTEDQCVHGF